MFQNSDSFLVRSEICTLNGNDRISLCGSVQLFVRGKYQQIGAFRQYEDMQKAEWRLVWFIRTLSALCREKSGEPFGQ